MSSDEETKQEKEPVIPSSDEEKEPFNASAIIQARIEYEIENYDEDVDDKSISMNFLRLQFAINKAVSDYIDTEDKDDALNTLFIVAGIALHSIRKHASEKYLEERKQTLDFIEDLREVAKNL